MQEYGAGAGVNRFGGRQIAIGCGVVLIGLLMLAYPFFTAALTSAALGWILLLAAIALLGFAFSGEKGSLMFLHLLTAVLVGICGFSLLAHPAAGAVSITLVLGIVLLIRAGVEGALAFRLKPRKGWGVFLADAVIVALLGVMILASWPASSLWTIGTLLGISVLSNGLSRIALGFGAKRASSLLA